MLNKFHLSRRQIEVLTAGMGTVSEVAELTGGMFASTYRVGFEDGSQAVLKATTTDDVALCRYERGIARTEALTYEMLGRASLPVPQVLRTDFTGRVVSADVVITSLLEGMPWSECALGEAEEVAAKRNLGALMASIHRVAAPTFGYPAPASQLSGTTWREAFTLMVEAILEDARRAEVALPFARVMQVVRANSSALDAVTVPVVVHCDLWPANIFLGDQSAIVGLIDTERTVWGDPLLDLVGADQLGLWNINEDVLLGDSESGGVLRSSLESESGQTRFALCRLYYSLILATEIDIRGYTGHELPAYRRRVAELVELSLQRLEELAVAGLD